MLCYVMLCYVMLLDVWNLNTSEHICGPYVEMLLFCHRHVCMYVCMYVCTLLQYCSLDINQKVFSVPTHITTRGSC